VPEPLLDLKHVVGHEKSYQRQILSTTTEADNRRLHPIDLPIQ